MCYCQYVLNSSRHLHGIHQLLMENALAIRPCNYGAGSEPLLPRVARSIPVLSSHCIGKCSVGVLKRSGRPKADHVIFSENKYVTYLNTCCLSFVVFLYQPPININERPTPGPTTDRLGSIEAKSGPSYVRHTTGCLKKFAIIGGTIQCWFAIHFCFSGCLTRLKINGAKIVLI